MDSRIELEIKIRQLELLSDENIQYEKFRLINLIDEKRLELMHELEMKRLELDHYHRMKHYHNVEENRFFISMINY